MRARTLCVLATAAGMAIAADPPYKYFVTGNPADVQKKTTAGFALVGGGKDQDAVGRWFLERSGGGDVVVIRASGADGYNTYFKGLSDVDSVETLVIATPEAANDPFVAEKIRHAEALFIAGGDQWNYMRIWKGSPVQAAVQSLIDRGVPVGGTSAGLAVLSEYVYTAEHDTVTSAQALADPFHERVTVGRDFVRIPILKGVIADMHFRARDRMGRTLAFLARMGGGKAIAVDEKTAVLAGADGASVVEGEGFAYFIRKMGKPEICERGKPLSYKGISVFRVPRGGRFDISKWSGSGGVSYELNVEGGVIHSTLADGSVY